MAVFCTSEPVCCLLSLLFSRSKDVFSGIKGKCILNACCWFPANGRKMTVYVFYILLLTYWIYYLYLQLVNGLFINYSNKNKNYIL